MPSQTEPKTHRANKTHRCHWCGETINKVEKYVCYRYFDGDHASTIKLHLECYAATSEIAIEEGFFEFDEYMQKRGCKEIN